MNGSAVSGPDLRGTALVILFCFPMTSAAQAVECRGRPVLGGKRRRSRVEDRFSSSRTEDRDFSEDDVIEKKLPFDQQP